MVVWKYGIISHVFTLHSLLDLWTTPVGGVDIHSLNGVFLKKKKIEAYFIQIRLSMLGLSCKSHIKALISNHFF